MSTDTKNISGEDRKLAEHCVASIAIAMCTLRGLPALGNDELGRIILGATGKMSPQELRNPTSLSGGTISEIGQLIDSAKERGRLVNKYAGPVQPTQGGPSGGTGPGGLGYHASLASALAARRDAAKESGASEKDIGSGARFDGMSSAAWASPAGMAMTRSYALNNGMGWVTGQPELMRLGQPAIQALHDTQLKQDGYRTLHDPKGLGFDAKTIVAGAAYMRRNQINYNEAAGAAGAVDALKGVPAALRAEHKKAYRDLIMSGPLEQDEHGKKLLKVQDKYLEQHPESKSVIEQEREILKLHRKIDRNATLERGTDSAAHIDSQKKLVAEVRQTNEGGFEKELQRDMAAVVRPRTGGLASRADKKTDDPKPEGQQLTEAKPVKSEPGDAGPPKPQRLAASSKSPGPAA